jgi:hypothetical protein
MRLLYGLSMRSPYANIAIPVSGSFLCKRRIAHQATITGDDITKSLPNCLGRFGRFR